MGWSHNYIPASGIPAKGVGKGDGWGGPAKGAGRGGAARPFTADTPTIHHGAADPAKTAQRKALAEDKAARLQQLKDNLADLALNADRQETQVSATIAWLNREEGMPIARNQNENRDLTFEELVKASLAPTST